MAHALQRLTIGDDPDAWRAAGFTVEDNLVALGKTVIELMGSEGPRGIRGWGLSGVTTDVDGLPALILPEHQRPSPSEHRNMGFAIDHIVVKSDDPARTSAAFEAVGLEERKRVEVAGSGGVPREQRFFWAGRVIVELVGPSKKPGARFWGLALVSANLEVATRVLQDALSEPRDAVQPGRKIATLRTGELGISVPIAFMSPHVANLGDLETA